MHGALDTMPLFAHATFLTTVNDPRQLPRDPIPEIAFAGRSNAGKSSAINALCGRTRLAFVSKTPGRTQHINFFRLTNGACLVDLPGYGYAKVPNDVQAHWQGLLEHYLSEREQLAGLVLMMDVRHPLTELDRLMLDWFVPRGLPVLVLLTKADKLARGPAMSALAKVRKALAAWPQCSVQLFSALKRQGLEDVEATVSGWVSIEPLADEAPAA